jgi:hypothetical protein
MNPRPLLHLEGAAVLAVSVFAYHSDHGSWGLFALLTSRMHRSERRFTMRSTPISGLYYWVRIQSRQIIGRLCCLR